MDKHIFRSWNGIISFAIALKGPWGCVDYRMKETLFPFNLRDFTKSLSSATRCSIFIFHTRSAAIKLKNIAKHNFLIAEILKSQISWNTNDLGRWNDPVLFRFCVKYSPIKNMSRGVSLSSQSLNIYQCDLICLL